MMNSKTKGRLMLLAIVFFFALPAVVAKTVLTNHWYQSGVTNKGVLIEPRITLSSLGLGTSAQDKLWRVGYVVPKQCDEQCQQHIYMLMQSHTALGKEQGRVEPVLLIEPESDIQSVEHISVEKLAVNQAFIAAIENSEIVIVDPLGQLVMHYPKTDPSQLVMQSKSVLADLRKLLKLSRVG
ncbi:hypothetical protein [Vibrio sp. Hal054]|uniref:hypothetical protein n=1 Tax=Vibrio sp. Hal054 TaxID=3035158 RepID=UPI00301CB67D